MADGAIHTHPSYGMVRFTRYQGGCTTLFGSSIQHSHTIGLTISEGERKRDLHCDWYHARRELIEVRMSPVQFAELVSSLNCGDGVPCTIERCVGDKDWPSRRPGCPDEHKRSEFENEFKDDIKQVAARSRKLADTINTVLAKKTLTQADRKEVAGMLSSLLQHIESSMPFVLTQFNEQIERTVVEAKGEIDAAMTHLLVRLGTEKLQEMIGGPDASRALGLIEGKAGESSE